MRLPRSADLSAKLSGRSFVDVAVVVFFFSLYNLTDVFCFFLFIDPLEDVVESTSQSVTNSAAELLKQGAGNQASLASNRHYDRSDGIVHKH